MSNQTSTHEFVPDPFPYPAPSKLNFVAYLRWWRLKQHWTKVQARREQHERVHGLSKAYQSVSSAFIADYYRHKFNLEVSLLSSLPPM